MLRWLFSPLLLALLGLSVGVGADFAVFLANRSALIAEWSVFGALAAALALLTFPTTLALLEFELTASGAIGPHRHLRHMWLVYPLWMISGLAFGGGLGSIVLRLPCAALSGVVLGNFAAAVWSSRVDARSRIALLKE